MTKISSIDQWKDVLLTSQNQAVAIFKHSNACPVSFGAHRRIEPAQNNSLIPVFLVVVQEARGVSDSIADDLDLKHESPQLIVIHQGKVIRHASHANIHAGLLEGNLAV